MRRQRLVEEQDLRIEGERPGQRDALALAARALLHALGVVDFGKPELAHQLERARLALRGLDAADLQRELDVLADGPVRKQRQRLEHHAGRPLVGRHVVDALAAQQDVAGGRRLHAGQHAQQRRLAAARRADDGEELAFGDVEVDAVDGGEGAESLAQRLERENGRAFARSRRYLRDDPDQSSLPHERRHAEGCNLRAVIKSWTPVAVVGPQPFFAAFQMSSSLS